MRAGPILDFHVHVGTGDPEEFDNGQRRDGFGGDLLKYNFRTDAYDPVSGHTSSAVPARQWMLVHLDRWMQDFRIDGIRMDSVNNIANWDFVQEFKDRARSTWHERAEAQGLSRQQTDERLQKVLTPEQWQQFQQLTKEFRDRRGERVGEKGRRGEGEKGK